jgi:hypothetical protein
MEFRYLLTAAALAAPLAAQPALASQSKWSDPVKVSDDLTIDPIAEGRLRYEHVDQSAVDADAVTMRLRAGAEFKMRDFSILAEAEGTLAIVDNYNAFPFVIADRQRRAQYATVPDPMNIELHRLQFQYKIDKATFTLGRQRINLDDQRWVGSVGWRQNEQTFDAVRGEAKVGPVTLDGTYAIGQRTIFGVDAGPRQAYQGDFFFGGAGIKAGPVNVKAFAYLLDYDEAFFLANSSKTFGIRAVAAIPLSPKLKLNLAGSYARQSDYGRNPFNYSADYVAAEAGISYTALTLAAGYEKLGSDNGRAVQTPMATLHKFNGWADVFLTTPNAGLQDIYGSVAYKVNGVKMLPGLNAAVAYHRYDSDVGGVDYGDEWNASLGFKIGTVGVLAKYADYHAEGFGADTRKFWLQAEFAY